MDKKNIIHENRFDKMSYNKDYNKKNYRRLQFYVKSDFYENFEKYAEDHGISKTELFRLAMEEYMDNHV